MAIVDTNVKGLAVCFNLKSDLGKKKNRQKIETINQSVESKIFKKVSNTFRNKIKFQPQIKCILMTSLAGSHTLHKRIAMLCLNEHCYSFMYCVGSTKRWCQNALYLHFLGSNYRSKRFYIITSIILPRQFLRPFLNIPDIRLGAK